MANSITKQFNMPPKIAKGISAVATDMNRKKSHVLGAAVSLFTGRPRQEIESEVRSGSSEHKDTMERVAVTLRKTVYSKLADAADGLGRGKAELVRAAAEKFLQLSSQEQEKAILSYISK